MTYYDGNSAVAERTQKGEFDTLANIAYNQIRNEIIDGTLAPGTRLIRRNLAKRLGVSPIPVTEALFRLEHQRLVQSEAMYGSRVRLFNLENIRSDQIIRDALECQTARICATMASPKQIETLFLKADILDGLFDEDFYLSQWQFYDEKHREFHINIAEIAGGDSLASELNRIWYCHQVWFRRIITNEETEVSEILSVPESWHHSLVASIASRNPAEAEEKMRNHLSYQNKKIIAAAEKILLGE